MSISTVSTRHSKHNFAPLVLALKPLNIFVAYTLCFNQTVSATTKYPQSSGFDNYFAQTGFSGLLRTPHAFTLNYGTLSINANYEDNLTTETRYHDGAHNTFLLGIGLTPFAEISIQNTWKRFHGDGGYKGGASSDLSFSAKLNLNRLSPFKSLNLAVGAQDIGGYDEATHHQNYYGVMSYRIHPSFSVSLGYGQGTDNNQMGANYLEGLFGGVQWQALDSLQVQADYDGTGYNAGIRLLIPDRWLPKYWQSGIHWQIASNSETVNRDNAVAGLFVNIPLWSVQPSQANQQNLATMKPQAPPSHPSSSIALHAEKTLTIDKYAPMQKVALPLDTTNKGLPEKIYQVLHKHGFQNIQIGVLHNQTAIAFENNTFNWNELDAIGVALGELSTITSDHIHLFLLNKKLPVLYMSANSDALQHFFQGDQGATQPHINVHSAITSAYRATHWSSRYNNSLIKPRLTIQPSLLSTIGTEWGVLDYSLAAAFYVQSDLWPGAYIDARYAERLAVSDDVKNDLPFAKHEEVFDQALFNQAFWLPGSVFNQFSFGLVEKNYHGWIYDAQYKPFNHEHTLGLSIGRLQHDIHDNWINPTLANYQWLSAKRRWGIKIEAGEYWQGDQGFKLSSHHWFGDTRVVIVYSDTSHDQGSNGFSSSGQFVGLFFEFPLTPRRDMKPRWLQIKGTESFIWGYKTRISDINYLGPNLAQGFGLSHNIARGFFNRNRLSPSYIKANMYRMKQAYQRWK